MRLSRFSLLIILIAPFFISCKKENIEKTKTNEIESFSFDYFIQYDHDLSVEHLLLNGDGSLIVTGSGKSNGWINLQPIVLKISSQYEISWLKFLDLDEKQIYRQNDIITTIDGQYLFLSYSDYNKDNEYDLDLTKLSIEGEVIWNKRIGEALKSERGKSIIQLPNQDYIILSRMTEGDFSSLTQGNLYLSRIGEDGTVKWSKTIVETGVSEAVQLLLDIEDQSFFVLSKQMSDLVLIDQPMVHKVDFDGNVLWEKVIETPGEIWFHSGCIIRNENENLVIAISGNHSARDSDYDVILIEMDTDGNELWRNSYGGENIEIAECLIQTLDGQYVLLSNTSSYGNGGLDVMLVKISETGEELWKKIYGSPSSDQGSDMVENNNGELIIVGNSNHGNSSDANFDFFLLRTDSEGNPF
ncbi:MAG: hypothetical protein GY705_25255 [Bacteroidetes bacterium]|nr:hypothetical protein [Bacteroidota bacterium]